MDLDGYKDRVQRSRAAAPDQRFDVQEMLADNNAVAVSWLGTARISARSQAFPQPANRSACPASQFTISTSTIA